LLAGALVLAASAAWAAADVAARLSRNTVAIGDTVELTIVVTGAVSGVGQPELPYLDGLAVISQSSNQTVSLGGGGVTAIMQYTYVLRAEREGSVTVPAIAVQVGRQTLKTTPLTLTVTGAAHAPAHRRPARRHRSQRCLNRRSLRARTRTCSPRLRWTVSSLTRGNRLP